MTPRERVTATIGVWAALVLSPPAMAQAAPVTARPTDAHETSSWWLLVEDLGCVGCRAEVYVDGRLVVLQLSGNDNLLIDLEDRMRPGRSEFMVFIRGPVGSGRMAVSVAKGRIRHEVVVFDDGASRYALQAEPTPAPVRFTIPATP